MKFSRILTMTIAMLLALVTLCAFASCSSCEGGGISDLFKTLFPCKHGDTEWRIMKNATCDEEGYRVHVCNKCGEEIDNETIVMLPHTVVSDKGHAATCSSTGLTNGSHCSVCKTVIVEQKVIDALPHTPVVDEAIAPDCVNSGLTEGEHCAVCGEVTVPQVYVEALGHDHVIVVEPTCTTYGYSVIACTVCGTNTEVDVKDPLGHTKVTLDSSFGPECDKDGVTYWECSTCKVTGYEIIPMFGHTVKKVHYPATCYESGKIVTFCTTCNKELAEPAYDADRTLNPDNHHALETRVTASANCTNDGTLLTYCRYCNYTKTEIIPKSHNWNSGTKVAPDCENKGYTLYVCNDCGATEKYDFVDALSHDYSIIIEIVLPVCGVDGYSKRSCSRDGCSSILEEVIKYVSTNPNHHGDHGKPAPVCNNPEHKTYSGVDVKPGEAECDCTGSSIINPPTEVNVGLEQYECEACGSRYYVVLPALPTKEDEAV